MAPWGFGAQLVFRGSAWCTLRVLESLWRFLITTPLDTLGGLIYEKKGLQKTVPRCLWSCNKLRTGVLTRKWIKTSLFGNKFQDVFVYTWSAVVAMNIGVSARCEWKGLLKKVIYFSCISSTFFVVRRWRCYAPTPAKNITVLPTDDYMAPWAQGLWGRGGASRDDLGAIRQMYLGSSGGCWWWLVLQFSTDFWMIEM